jgi:hypothetical protein
VLASSVPVAATFAGFVYVLGHFTTNLLEWVQRMGNPGLQAVVKGMYYLAPNFSVFNLKEGLEQTQSVPGWGVFLWPWGYALAYGGVVFLFALWRYERKDF